MTNALPDQFCERCGATLPPRAQFCEQCGIRVTPQPVAAPGAYPVSPVSPRLPLGETKRSLPWLLPVIGIGCLGLLCIGVLVVGMGFFLRNKQYLPQEATTPAISTPLSTKTHAAEPSATAVEEPALEPSATPVKEPTLEPTPLPTVPPEVPTAPSAGETLSAHQYFARWPLDYSLQWEMGQTDIYITDINQDQSWIIGLNKPDSLVMVIPPNPSAYYLGNAIIRVKVKPADFTSSGPYGVLCHFQDENNYYLVEIQGESYGVGKMVNGKFIPLTDPYWQESQFIGNRDARDFVELGVACVDYTIGVSINGLGETYPIDDPARSFSGGAVALFGASGQEAVDMLMGIYYFKDLVIEVIN